jgi:hypothetical protein
LSVVRLGRGSFRGLVVGEVVAGDRSLWRRVVDAGCGGATPVAVCVHLENGAVVDQEIEFIELGECCFQREVAASGLQPLHKITRARIEETMGRLDQGMTDGGQQMRLAAVGIADGDEVVAGLDPIASGQRHDSGFGDRHAGSGPGRGHP